MQMLLLPVNNNMGAQKDERFYHDYIRDWRRKWNFYQRKNCVRSRCFAGELGHTIIRPGGRLHKGTGIRGPLEAYASATGVRETALEMMEQNPSIPSLLRAINPEALTSEKSL